MNNKKNWKFLLDDIIYGLKSWRIWILLGLSDIRQRYKRSRLGQFWITISTGVFIAAVGYVNSVIFNQEISTFIPYVATNLIVWHLVSGIINDGSYAFINSDSYIKQIPLPKTIFIMRSLTKNFVNFFHNCIILLAVFVAFPFQKSINLLLVPVGLVLILLTGFLITIILGILSARFRDIPQVVNNFIQLVFFITPIMWPIEAIRGKSLNLDKINPFIAYINILGKPLRGELPGVEDYGVVIIVILILIIAVPFFSKYRARIVYWL